MSHFRSGEHFHKHVHCIEKNTEHIQRPVIQNNTKCKIYTIHRKNMINAKMNIMVKSQWRMESVEQLRTQTLSLSVGQELEKKS